MKIICSVKIKKIKKRYLNSRGKAQTLESSTVIGRFKRYCPESATSISSSVAILKLLFSITCTKNFSNSKIWNTLKTSYKVDKLPQLYGWLFIWESSTQLCNFSWNSLSKSPKVFIQERKNYKILPCASGEMKYPNPTLILHKFTLQNSNYQFLETSTIGTMWDFVKFWIGLRIDVKKK